MSRRMLLLLAFVFGILGNDGVQPRENRVEAKASILRWRILLPVLGLTLGVQSYCLLPAEFLSSALARRGVTGDQAAVAFAARGLTTEKQDPNLRRF